MQVFKAFFLVMKRMKTLVMIYFLVYTVLGITIVLTSSDSDDNTYHKTDINIAVIDEDHSTLAKAIQKELGKSNTLVPLKNNEKEIQDKLYWRNVEYILTIPKGFEQAVKDGKNTTLHTKMVEQAYDGAYVDQELKQYLRILKMYLNAGYSMEDAISCTQKSNQKNVSVSFYEDKDGNTQKVRTKSGQYFKYAPCVLISVCITVIGMVMLEFNEENVKKRMACSSLPLKQRNLQFALASILLALAVFVIEIINGGIVTKGYVFTDHNLMFYMINLGAFLLVTLAIAFLVGTVMHSDNAVNGINNVVGLGFCFLGGIFVPLEIMPDAVVKFAHFVPTYWYVQANDMVAYMTKVNSGFLQKFFQSVGVELCFAAAIFVVALVCSKRTVRYS